MVEEAQKMITTIRQMEASLDDGNQRRDNQADGDGELKITYPLTRCLKVLKEKHIQVSRLHRERYEQVKSTPSSLGRGLELDNANIFQNWCKPSSLIRSILNPPL